VLRENGIDEGEIFLGWCENMDRDLIESAGNGVNISGYGRGVRGRRRK
jgi:hypothetical protein